jgi:hypothetical protein
VITPFQWFYAGDSAPFQWFFTPQIYTFPMIFANWRVTFLSNSIGIPSVIQVDYRQMPYGGTTSTALPILVV